MVWSGRVSNRPLRDLRHILRAAAEPPWRMVLIYGTWVAMFVLLSAAMIVILSFPTYP